MWAAGAHTEEEEEVKVEEGQQEGRVCLNILDVYKSSQLGYSH